ncbi:B-box zinc finger domain-containing protein [Theileria equi strain WA]|uniref:B-box zinc finger domain-containing protein n=1 Tax=Theileria equi strain WA TaxID=1537102 RepID=L0B1X0_THEEQ|nr:B-box zinc finger domain-containing protein [Theileria equi strain WA]AFZ81129.1 B-box zinc finger domain-containing protein [Theileria equi strain WA]|eukprot:XP_004830795.1 B-box zinc finger domain-containing protein [Theileria equi strain WA]
MENPVIRDSDEWDSIEFALQLRCRSSRVRLLQAWNITKAEPLSMFNRRSKNTLVLESFIDSSALDRYNSVQNVCTRGFEIGANGFIVTIGNLSLPGFPLLNTDGNGGDLLANNIGTLDNSGKIVPPKSATISETTFSSIHGDKKVFEYFICDVAVGKSIKVPNVLEAQRSRVSMPAEYDSYFLSNSESEKFDTITVSNTVESGIKNPTHLVGDHSYTKGVLPKNAFKHEYIIYDSSQILPKYLIQFECNPSAEESYALPLCDNCQNDVATIYCSSDAARMCTKCDTRIHSQNKVVSRHIRMPLNEMPRAQTKCKIHRSKSYHLYCIVCNVPICQLCTSNHIHNNTSDGILRETTFIPINIAYESAVLDLKTTSNYIIDKRRKELMKVLSDIETVKNVVSDNCQSVEAACYEMLEEALKNLQHLVDKSLGIVLSEQTENKRQLNEINWSEYFIGYMRSNLLPPDYLRSWLCHCRLRNQLSNNSYKGPQKELFADIVLEAELSIVPEDVKLQNKT